MEKQKEVKAQSYTLREENGQWLGQVIITNDGLFASVTDYGNFSFAWRSYGDDFKDFLININVDYFAGKMYNGLAYIAYGRKYELACKRFAEKILPPLQNILKEEMGSKLPEPKKSETKIYDLDISTRSMNVLKLNEIKTLEQLSEFTPSDFLKLRCAGMYMYKEITEVLKLHGMSWNDDDK